MLPRMPLAAAATGTGAPNQQMLDQIHFYQVCIPNVLGNGPDTIQRFCCYAG